MLRKEQNGLVWYESESLTELGVRHGFFTNSGGVSQGEFKSLNVKYDIGDNSENVKVNRQKILDQLGKPELYFAKLVHGSEFAEVTGENQSEDVENVDGLITDQKNIAVGLSVADCLPIIISDGNLLAVVHAGWRGTVARITENIVKELIDQGLDLAKTVAVTGPCICKKHFEVRDEAAQSLSNLAGESLQNDSYFADLLELNIQQLRTNDISKIDSLDSCSIESDEWFSYRRDKGKTGRNMAIAILA